MRYIALASLVVAILMALPGCRAIVRETRRDTAVQRHQDTEVIAALARYRQLVLEVDARRLADMFDDQGELSHNDQKPTTGRETILAFFNSFAAFKVLEYELRATSTSVDGQSATQSGTYSQKTLAPSGETIKAEGSFKAEWRHQSDGRWLLRRMHTSSAGGAYGG